GASRSNATGVSDRRRSRPPYLPGSEGEPVTGEPPGLGLDVDPAAAGQEVGSVRRAGNRPQDTHTAVEGVQFLAGPRVPNPGVAVVAARGRGRPIRRARQRRDRVAAPSAVELPEYLPRAEVVGDGAGVPAGDDRLIAKEHDRPDPTTILGGADLAAPLPPPPVPP